ncbi:MAG: hypothetical protein OXL36_14935 [Bryobacterales bacterium]|nr:hypothetical protein [Bryobacterales bacterium]MDE0295856.1 hypothetical protein [Bryobacterales bacterium]
MIEPTDETRRLVWDELVDSDRMCRYYGYLTHRLRNLEQLLQFVAVFAAFAGLAGVLLQLPWITLPSLAVAASAGAISTLRNYSDKALQSNEIFRELGRLAIEWELLWNNLSAKDDDTVLASWKKLSERQFALVERVPFDLPLSPSLARKSQQEAYEYWSEFAHADQSSATALVSGESRDAAASIAHH